jgi:hypothetical protein
MMQDDDSLPTILTCGVEGSRSNTKDDEGEVWTTSLPHPTSTLERTHDVMREDCDSRS